MSRPVPNVCSKLQYTETDLDEGRCSLYHDAGRWYVWSAFVGSRKFSTVKRQYVHLLDQQIPQSPKEESGIYIDL